MPTLPTNSARWSIAPSGLRMSCSKSLAFRATPPSTTPTVRPREPASSSINGSSSARTRTATTCPKRLSAVSIPPSGSPAMSHITPSTMPKTVHLNILAVRVLPQLSVSSCLWISQFCLKQPLTAPSIHCSLYHF